MKNKIIIIALTLFSFFSCKAQTPIIDLHNNDNYGEVTNAYYKDIENFQNQFIGTWLYENGNTSLKVRFRKLEMFYTNNGVTNFFIDVLVGEYQYIENGVEKVNTLMNLNVNYNDYISYNLFSFGDKISLTTFPKCNECPPSTERMSMFFNEPTNDDAAITALFVMRKVIENGIEKIKVQFVLEQSAGNVNKNNMELPSTFRTFSLPYGNYTLIKQP